MSGIPNYDHEGIKITLVITANYKPNTAYITNFPSLHRLHY